MIDEQLKEWATPKQVTFIDAINKHKGYRAAAREIGVHHTTLMDSMRSLERIGASKGYAPSHNMTKVAPDPFIVKGTSSYYDKDGALAGQWVKTTLDQQKLKAAVLASIDALVKSMPKAKQAPKVKVGQKDLCVQYTFTDCHVGMRSWAAETGGDWDLEIAERVLTGAFDHLIQSAPNADAAVVAQLGDWLHYDSLAPITPTSGHVLDADGRYSKVIGASVRILRYIIDRALLKHRKVIVLMAEGNHDMASSVWLRHIFSLLYENEKRVEVINTESPYYAYQHGETMLAYHHGHMKKNSELPGLFAAEFAKMWGSTIRRYCHTGHRHHTEEKEHAGMMVIQHPTIAARDAYAARGGWVADRQISSITYHSKYGQVGRNTVVPEMLGG